MRKVVLIAFFASMLISALLSQAFAGDTIKDCRLNEMDSHFNNLTEQMEFDLLNGIWTIKYNDGSHRFQFHDYGIVDVFSTVADGSVKHYSQLWRVEEFNNAAFLVLTTPFQHKDKLYKMRATCDGVVLTDLTQNKQLEMNVEPVRDQSYLDGLNGLLIGSWASTALPFDNEEEVCTDTDMSSEAQLSLTFNEDGTYELFLDDRKNGFQEDGVWAVSDDGEYIIFHVMNNKDPESAKTTRMARITWLEDEMIGLEQSLHANNGTAFCTKWKEFSFAKYHVN